MTKKNNERINFANSKSANVATDFLDIQIKSFKDFFQLETRSDERVEEGLFNTFKENFPITDARSQFVLEFIDYFGHGRNRGFFIYMGMTFFSGLETIVVLYGAQLAG